MVQPIIFGASGFIGKHLIQELGSENCLPVSRTSHVNPHWVQADLTKLSSIKSILRPNATVINLAYSQQASKDENSAMAANLVRACQEVNVRRIVHCSTVVVIGKNTSYYVDEETECFPETAYEKTKYEIENIFLQAISDDLSVTVLRPTGVLGPNGKNLKKMFFDIYSGSPLINFLRSSLYGKRRLNLVPINNVVKALIHLSDQAVSASGVYICAADDDLDNHYHHLEKLMRSLLQKPAPIQPIYLPSALLGILLRASRSGCGRVANRHYSSKKLYATGFQCSSTLAETVKEFILSEHHQ